MTANNLKAVLSDLKTDVPFEDPDNVVKNLTDSDASFCYLWDVKQCHVVATKLDGSARTSLVPTDTPLFNVTSLKVCPFSGRWIVLSGPKGIVAMQVPGKIAPKGLFFGSSTSMTV